MLVVSQPPPLAFLVVLLNYWWETCATSAAVGGGRGRLNPNVAYQDLSTRQGKRSLHLLAKLWHFVRYYGKGFRSQNPALDSSSALRP